MDTSGYLNFSSYFLSNLLNTIYCLVLSFIVKRVCHGCILCTFRKQDQTYLAIMMAVQYLVLFLIICLPLVTLWKPVCIFLKSCIHSMYVLFNSRLLFITYKTASAFVQQYRHQQQRKWAWNWKWTHIDHVA